MSPDEPRRFKDICDLEEALTVHRTHECPFCSDRVQGRVLYEWGTVVAIPDKNPVTKGHVLIMTERHVPDYFSMTLQEREDATVLLNILKDAILEEDDTVTGFNIGINCGASAGQTVMHAHIHLIPRRDGDIQEPKGGVRGVIPHKMSY